MYNDLGGGQCSAIGNAELVNIIDAIFGIYIHLDA